MWQQIGEAAVFKHNQPDAVNTISHRIEVRDVFCPVCHAFNRREKAAHQHENHHEKEYHKHRLLLGFAVNRNQKPHAKNGDKINRHKGVEQKKAAFHPDVIHKNRHQ